MLFLVPKIVETIISPGAAKQGILWKSAEIASFGNPNPPNPQCVVRTYYAH